MVFGKWDFFLEVVGRFNLLFGILVGGGGVLGKVNYEK